MEYPKEYQPKREKRFCIGYEFNGKDPYFGTTTSNLNIVLNFGPLVSHINPKAKDYIYLLKESYTYERLYEWKKHKWVYVGKE